MDNYFIFSQGDFLLICALIDLSVYQLIPLFLYVPESSNKYCSASICIWICGLDLVFVPDNFIITYIGYCNTYICTAIPSKYCLRYVDMFINIYILVAMWSYL